MIEADKKIYIAGHNGMVGSAILRQLSKTHSKQILTIESKDLDLTNQEEVNSFFNKNNISEVYLAAAKVGGIYANDSNPAEFIYNNIMIQANVINAAYQSGARKLLFLGSSCIYPRKAPQPMAEDSLLKGELEPTNEPYAIAKIAGIKMCESYNRQYNTDYRSLMPTNLYGPFDNFHPQNSHVIPALIRRFHEAVVNKRKSITIWGTGNPLREFLHVDDLASAAIHLMHLEKGLYSSSIKPQQSHINVGSGSDLKIEDLSRLIAKVVHYTGKINFDSSMPDGAPKKLMDTSLMNSFGWEQKINLEQGLTDTYNWYLENHNK